MAVSREQREEPTGEGWRYLSEAGRNGGGGEKSQEASTGSLVCMISGHMLIGTQMPHLARQERMKEVCLLGRNHLTGF